MGNQPGQTLKADPNDENEILRAYPVKYLGSAPVPRPKGQDVAFEAVSRVMTVGQPPRKVILNISSSRVFVQDKYTLQDITQVPLSFLSFVTIDPRDKRLVSLIYCNPRESIMTCHVFKSKKDSLQIPVTINEAFQKLQTNVNSRSSMKRTPSENGEPSADAADEPPPPTPTSSSTSKSIQFKASYFGHVTVAGTTGKDVLFEATRRIKDMKQKRKCWVLVSNEKIQIRDRFTDEVFQNALVSEISFSSLEDKDKCFLGFITCDAQQVSFCHLLHIKKTAQPLASAISDAFVFQSEQKQRQEILGVSDGQISNDAAAFARKLSTVNVEPQTPAPRSGAVPIGVFEGQFIGSITVEQVRGQEVCIDAIQRLLPTVAENASVAVAIVVTPEGLRVVEALTSELVSSTFIKNISFTTVVDSALIKIKGKKLKYYDPFFSFVSLDDRIQQTVCHVFRCRTSALDVCAAVNRAFQINMEEQKKVKNPFAPVSENREPVKGILFKYQIHRRDLFPKKVIGTGQFGEVYLALQAVRPGTGDAGGDSRVRAVKLLRNGATVNDRLAFLQEAETMLHFNHPNLVRMVGVAVQQRPWLAVMEYVQYGDLRGVLRACLDRKLALTHIEQLKLAVQIASGMDYLSELRYIHMDLAARNCLLHVQNVVKIGDFGLTKRMEPGRNYYRLNTTLKLPIKWMALESMDDKVFSSKSDVWAFGIVCWEIMSYGAQPYEGIANIDVQARVREGVRLSSPRDCPPAFYDLCRSCWEVQWAKRPTFKILREKIMEFAFQAREVCPPMRDIGKVLNLMKQKTFDPTQVSSEALIHDDQDLTEGPENIHSAILSRIRSDPQKNANMSDPIGDYDAVDPKLKGPKTIQVQPMRSPPPASPETKGSNPYGDEEETPAQPRSTPLVLTVRHSPEKSMPSRSHDDEADLDQSTTDDVVSSLPPTKASSNPYGDDDESPVPDTQIEQVNKMAENVEESVPVISHETVESKEDKEESVEKEESENETDPKPEHESNEKFKHQYLEVGDPIEAPEQPLSPSSSPVKVLEPHPSENEPMGSEEGDSARNEDSTS